MSTHYPALPQVFTLVLLSGINLPAMARHFADSRLPARFGGDTGEPIPTATPHNVMMFAELRNLPVHQPSSMDADILRRAVEILEAPLHMGVTAMSLTTPTMTGPDKNYHSLTDCTRETHEF